MATSPNMLLTIPAVGVTPGPEYAQQVNVSLGIVDTHDHSPGKGVQITPDGLNINSPLDIQNNTLLNTGAVVLSPVLSFGSNSSVYSIGAELYYRDGIGNQVQITQGGSVNAGAGTITGLPSGTASASFSAVAEKFIFQSSTGVGAYIDASSYIMRNHTAGSFGLTIQAPTAMSADYTITMPSLPPVKRVLTMTTSGAIAAEFAVDPSIQISSTLIGIPDAGVGTAKIADAAVTAVKIADANVTTAKIANSAVTVPKLAPAEYNTTTYAAQTHNNTTVTILTFPIVMPVAANVRPVEIILENSGNNPWLAPSMTRNGATPTGSFIINIAGTPIATLPLDATFHNLGMRFFYRGLLSGAQTITVVLNTGNGIQCVLTAARLTTIQY